MKTNNYFLKVECRKFLAPALSKYARVTVLLFILLIIFLQGFSQTSTLNFTQVPYSNADLIAPGRGAEHWNSAIWDNTYNPQIPAGNSDGLNVYYRFNWRDIETAGINSYNWTIFDQQVNNAIADGKMFSFGIMTLCTACGTSGLIPDYLHQLMQGEASNSQDWNYGGTWIPNWNSPNYLSRMEALLNAVGNHINTTSYLGRAYKDVIYYVDVRGYGDFGEWHNYPYYSSEPAGRTATVASLIRIIDAHKTAFPNYPLMIPMGAYDGGNSSKIPAQVSHYALTTSNAWGEIGWRRDNFGDAGYSSWLSGNTGSYGGTAFAPLIMNKWKYSLVGGEPANDAVAISRNCGTPQCDLENEIRTFHVTSFGNGNYPVSATNVNLRANVIAASKASGYRLVLIGGSMTTLLTPGSPFNVTLNWQNIGIAPAYENWNAVYELRNSSGGVVWSGTSAFKPKFFLPQASPTPSSDGFTLPSGVAPGTYSLYLLIKDPLGYKKHLPLAITGRNADGSYLLLNNITVGAGSGNLAPSANAGIDQTIQLPATTSSFTGSGTDPDGTISTYSWTKVSGPAGGTIGSPASASTAITGMATAGTFVFRLTVADNVGATATDNIQIIVNAASNQAPTANAGTDITITLPTSSASLNGSGSDPDGTISTYAWTKVSGPAGGTIGSPATSSTAITGMTTQGTYVFRLTITDNGGATIFDDVQIIVNSAPIPNQTPIANAGTDITITLPTSSATLNGLGTDPDGTISTYAWTKVSGPVGGVIGSSSTASTGITSMNSAGTYVYRLTVTDNRSATGSDDVQIIVNDAPAPAPAPAPNQTPSSNSGADITITLPTNSATLNGSGTDPDGTISFYVWTKVSGPVGGVIGSSSTASTGITSMNTAGTYTYKLTVTDNGGATGSDDVQIIVISAPAPAPTPAPAPAPNQAPTANAGANIAVALPISSTILSGSGTDPDGTITSYAWTKISGPSGETIASPGTASTTISGLTAGDFVYRLTVTDNGGATAASDIVVNVTDPSKAPVPTPTPNQAPIANAGQDLTLILPANGTLLNGTLSNDPDGSIVNWSWSLIQGPAGSTLANSTSSSPSLTVTRRGTYTFELTVTDDLGLTSTDRMTVNVIRYNKRPRAMTTYDSTTVKLPVQNTLVEGSSSYDSDGSITSYNWSYVSGPSSYKILSPDSANTVISNLTQGSYQFALEVTDDDSAADKRLITIIVKNSSSRMEILDVKLRPNPAVNDVYITINSDVQGRSTITLVDIKGTPVYREVFDKSSYSITRNLKVNSLRKGTYFVVIKVDGSIQMMKKLIVL